MSEPFPSAGYLRMHAEELRTIADSTISLDARMMLARLSYDYDRLAAHQQRREERKEQKHAK